MSFFVDNWLPTLLGATVFVGFALAVLAILSAMASKIEERFTLIDDQDIDIGVAA
jgi:hypothetical protein